MSGRRHRRSAKDDEKQSCCSWPRIILLVVLLAVCGVLIWKFAPIDEAIDTVLPDFSNTTNNGGSGNSGGGGNDIDDLNPPTDAPIESYGFMQCQDPSSTACCNGLDGGVCNLRVDQAMFATVHNAMATFQDGFIFGPNHKLPLEQSLAAGYRGINLDVCNCGGQLNFCHGICTLGPRQIDEVMENMNEFLDANPSEIVVFLFQINSGVDQEVDMNEFAALIRQIDDGQFASKIYQHASLDSPWPTLGQLRNPQDNRVSEYCVMFRLPNELKQSTFV